MEKGVNYYDTAWGYHGGNSELAMGEALSAYPRESFYLADKFPGYDLSTLPHKEEIFETQLKKCGVEYFDFYLMHAQSAEIFKHFKNCRAYETAFELKKEGKVRHVGISFHDRAEVLEQILTEIRPGVTEKEIAARLQYHMLCFGAEKMSFDPIVAVLDVLFFLRYER